ncbi:multiheme c-type cytochrome [Vibrio chagasii]|uniref:multiheme c-type cytochrome n=1 Tax=Vibrio chagasii TaxID=170679 RepID=UPI00337CDD05|nr:Deca-heme c-type cytochrome [Vibrio chagasii]
MQKKSKFFLLLFTLSIIISTFSWPSSAEATFSGSQTCVECHIDQTEAWKGSHHEKAMQHANSNSVLANFNDQQIQHDEKKSYFYTQGEEFWFRTEGKNTSKEYKISYTFGFSPLQQYMVELADGRVQLIPFAWDSRTAKEGGQRWFMLYPDTDSTDEFYWLNTGQNWNFMCADCHSTNLKKNYNKQNNTYSTEWSEISVGCEACHGPASEHIRLAKGKINPTEPHFGFQRDLSKAVESWLYKEGHSTLQPGKITSTDQVQTCAQCHSRRIQLNETKDHVTGAFGDKYRLDLISSAHYHTDGQISAENFVYGSFLQSKMAQKGVTCTNCHDPHSAKLKIPETSVCLQCHISSEYASETHTFHEAETDASKCTTCHMPETTYMQVDPRRDHSWHVPKAAQNTPNACLSCHENKDTSWVSEQLQQWFPQSKHRNPKHFSEIFLQVNVGESGSKEKLSLIALNTNLSQIIRASALERMSGGANRSNLEALRISAKDENYMVRLGVISGSSGYNFSIRWSLLEPLLTDEVLAVRTESASALVNYWSQLSPQQKNLVTPPLNEYINTQNFNADRAFARTNLGNTYLALGKSSKAIEEYLGAIEVEPYFERSYINLSDLYQKQGDNKQATDILLQGIAAQPKSHVLPYAAGLAYLRTKDEQKSLKYLQRAVEIANNNSHYWYVYGLALEKSNILKSSKALHNAFQYSGNPQYLYAQCDVLARNYKKVKLEFDSCVNELSELVPPKIILQLKSKIR